MSPMTVPGIPFSLVSNAPSVWTVDGPQVRADALPTSDIFIDPSGSGLPADNPLNAATLMGELPPGDFTFRALVEVDFASTFDAGVLLLWFDEQHWVKLCFEYTPQGHPSVVSVVNRGVSDDNNHHVVEGNRVWLRMSRVGRVFALHASNDGARWDLLRVFRLDAPEGSTATIGLEAQSPVGKGCRVVFSEIEFASRTLGQLRDGS